MKPEPNGSRQLRPWLILNVRQRSPMFSNTTREIRKAILTKLGFVMPPLVPESVPAPLRSFIPVAEFWGLPEDAAMKELVDAATEEEVETLFDTVQKMPEEFDRWLATPPPEPGKISREYVRFSCLFVAYEFAKLRLKPKKPNQSPEPTAPSRRGSP